MFKVADCVTLLLLLILLFYIKEEIFLISFTSFCIDHGKSKWVLLFDLNGVGQFTYIASVNLGYRLWMKSSLTRWLCTRSTISIRFRVASGHI